jgi:hypothetical protein
MIRTLRTVELEGTPNERGRIHGEVLKPLINELVERWRYMISLHYGNPNTFIKRFMNETMFVDSVKKWAPHLLDEVEGIGEGADIDFNTVFTLQCMDEQWWFTEMSAQTERCSSLGCYREEDTPTLLAQNGDLPSLYDGFQTLLHVKHQNPSLESFVCTYAGLIAAWGLNNQAVGICTNTLIDLNHSSDGLPVAFLIRMVLEQPSLEEAVKFIKSVKHASGQNYIIGGLEEVVCLECSSNMIREYTPYEEARRVYHTNHPLVNNDAVLPLRYYTGTSRARFSYFDGRLRDPSKKVTVDKIKHILSSHDGPVCVHNNYQPVGSVTFASLIYELSKPPVLHITAGPPCSSEWKVLRF